MNCYFCQRVIESGQKYCQCGQFRADAGQSIRKLSEEIYRISNGWGEKAMLDHADEEAILQIENRIAYWPPLDSTGTIPAAQKNEERKENQ